MASTADNQPTLPREDGELPAPQDMAPRQSRENTPVSEPRKNISDMQFRAKRGNAKGAPHSRPQKKSKASKKQRISHVLTTLRAAQLARLRALTALLRAVIPALRRTKDRAVPFHPSSLAFPFGFAARKS